MFHEDLKKARQAKHHAHSRNAQVRHGLNFISAPNKQGSTTLPGLTSDQHSPALQQGQQASHQHCQKTNEDSAASHCFQHSVLPSTDATYLRFFQDTVARILASLRKPCDARAPEFNVCSSCPLCLHVEEKSSLPHMHTPFFNTIFYTLHRSFFPLILCESEALRETTPPPVH